MPSSSDTAPAATAAVYSPRLWPATTSGRRPRSRATSVSASESAKSAGWAAFVSVSDSIGPSSDSCRICEARRLVGRVEVAVVELRLRLPELRAHADLLRALARVEERELAHQSRYDIRDVTTASARRA